MGTTINIISTNDIHGRFFGGFGEAGEIDFSRLRTLRESLEHSLLVDVGDATQGTPLAILHKGLDPIDIMNSVGYDVTTIGNHEFDNITLKDENENELDAIIAKFNAPFICTNVYWKGNSEDPINYIEYVYKKKGISDRGNGRYLAKEVAGKKLLFVGVCTPVISDTPKMKAYVIKGKPSDDGEDSMVAQIRSAIAAAKEEHGNFDAVILLTHLGKDTEGYSSSKLISTLTAEDRKDIKLIIDGHSHKKYFDAPTEPGGPYLLQADCYGKLCAHITLNFDDAGGLEIKNSFLDAAEINIEKIAQNGEVEKKIGIIKKKVDAEFETALCSGSNTTLWGGAVDEEKPFVPKDLAAINVTRHIHTNMGRLAAAAIAHYIRIKKAGFFDAEANYIIAGINGGGVRDSIRFGQEINYGKLYGVVPSQREGLYDSGIAVFKITLSRLKAVLENSVSQIKVEDHLLTTNAGMFLNTFGLKYAVDYNVSSSPKINDSATLTCGTNDFAASQTISFEKDKDKKVLICVNKYLATGGDGYPFKFDKDENLVEGGLDIDTPIYQIMGDYIKQLAASSDEIMFYPAVSDDIQYNGFHFPKPEALNITVKDERNNLQKGIKIVYAFVNERGYHNFGAAITDDNGVFTVTPPEGANTLCIAALLSEASVDNTFLYGEIFTHSYLKMERSLECQVSQMNSSKYCLFSKHHLSQFKRSYIGSTSSHHSNYLDFIDANGDQCALTVADNKIYSRKGSESHFARVSSVIYTNAKGEKSTLTLPFPKDGIDYIPWVGQTAKVHADLIKNLEISDYYGGGDPTESSTYCDGTLFAKNRQNKVIGFHIRSGDILDGIGFVYAGDEEFFFGNSAGGADTRIHFSQGEYIEKIEGAINAVYPYYYGVTNLRITTNKNSYGPFGTHKGEEQFSFGKAEKGKMIAAILGEEATQEKWQHKIVKRIAVAYANITV